MERISTFLFAVVMTACLPSTARACVKGIGAVVTKTIEVAAMHGIVLDGSMDVVLTKAPVQKVEVEAQANLIELIEVRVVNGIWHINTREGFSTDKEFVVHISLPMVDQVSLAGSGDVTSEGTFDAGGRMKLDIAGSGNIALAFTAGETTADIAGSGDMTLSGTSGELLVNIQGSGDVNARALKALQASVDIAGSGDVQLNASESLTASIQGSGDVVYSGDPKKVSKEVMGSGEIRSASGAGRL
jgi:hypothetical protein